MRLRRVRAWLCWWFALFWLWALLVGSWDLIDLVAGACVSAVAAAIGEAGRAAARVDVQISWERFRAGALAPLLVPVDFGILTYALCVSVLRRKVVRGRYLARPFDPGTKTTPSGAARRAWTVLLAGYSPNAYVVDIDVEERRVLLHDLIPWRRSEEPA